MADGFINVYKEKNYTSFDVVAKLRGILKQKKIGHTGTLDPLAEGVLLVCLGNATKLVDYLTEKNKEYVCTLLLGKTSDTEDISGIITAESHNIPDEEEVKAAIMSFKGSYDQIPPMYSAIRIKGKKLYELARQGIVIERESRHVEIFDIEITDMKLPEVTFRVVCSKGTYIRSLCRDIGDRLSCGALMKSLTRTEVRGFSIEDSLRLDEIEKMYHDGSLPSHIIPTDSLLSDLPAYMTNGEADKYLFNGNRLDKNELTPFVSARFNETEDELCESIPSRIRVYNSQGNFTAIYSYDIKEKNYKAYKMFITAG